MNKKAFTLIELLVVVLIIGILSAIALPQYQKAVMKARFTQLKVVANAIANAEEVYYLANNKYTGNFDDLDINTPPFTSEKGNTRTFTWGDCWIVPGSESDTDSRVACDNRDGLTYYVHLKYGASQPGIRRCRGQGANENSIQNQICKAETGAISGTPADGCIYWRYQ